MTRHRCPHCGSALVAWKKPAILEAARRWHRENGRSPRSTDWQHAEPWHPSQTTVARMFGSWPKMLAEAGLDVPRRQRHKGIAQWSREEVVAAIFKWRFQHGRLPRRDEWRVPVSDDWPSAWVVRRLFGSWNAAIVAAGYEPFQPHRVKRTAHSYRSEMAAITKRARTAVEEQARAEYVAELVA